MCLVNWYNRHMVKRKLPPDDVIAAQYLAGHSTEQIAAEHGVAPTAVKNILKRLGITRRTLSEAAKLRAERGIIPAPRRGADSPKWKGGPVNQTYHRAVTRERCARCGAMENLGVHHKDFDHYNNAPENLQALCVSCHMTVHKLAYWKAKREGTEYKSNAPIHWKPKA